MHYNFCPIHQTLRVTPAMEAGIADRVWSLEETVSLLDKSAKIVASDFKAQLRIGLMEAHLCSKYRTGVSPMQSYCLEPPEDMAIRDEIKTWAREEIHAAIHEHLNPHGWRKLQQFLPLAGVLAVFVGLLALAGAGWNYAFSRVGQEATFQTRTTDRLGTIDDNLKTLNIAVAEIRLKQASSNPADPQSIKEAQNVLHAAKASKVELSKDAIAETGKRFIEAANKTPEAWNAALDFLNYRSSLNVYVRAVSTVNVPAGAKTNFDIGPVIAGKPIPTLMHIPIGVAPKDAARFERIGQNLNQQLQFGSAQLMLTGGAVTLDDKYVRHAVFDGVEVHYTGKPLILQDALFINCTFVLENTQLGRQLGQALLASSTVNFEKAS